MVIRRRLLVSYGSNMVTTEVNLSYFWAKRHSD